MDQRRFLPRLARLFAILLLACSLAAQPADQPAQQLEPGSAAPPFSVTSIEGQHLELAAMRGKVLVLNFWFIACPPCRVEIPNLNRLVENFAGKDVVFVGFSPDSPGQLRQFLAETEFKYLIVPHSTQVAEKYGIRGAPVHVVIDKEGKVHWIRYGALDSPEVELARIIKEVL